MPPVVIDNPVINSAFDEPQRHFKFDEDGITNEISDYRRISHYFVPIARPKKKSQQLEFDLGLLSQDRVEENKTINRIRERVSLWRRSGHQGVTPTTRRLLEHWKNPDRERRLLQITKEWLSQCVTYKSGTFIQELLLIELAHDTADCIYRAIAGSEGSQKTLKPILRPYDTFGSTRYVDFDTTKPVYITDSTKCHISHVVADTDSWEQKMAQVLEDLPEVICYVKNQGLGFTIPYTLSGQQKNYTPDFIVRVKDGNVETLNLIVEVSGEARKDKAAKITHARQFWIPAVNNHGALSRWGIIEITDPWDAANTIKAFLSSPQTGGQVNDRD
ncbi:hypothetical protein DO97_20665 [Neosynechococcus sphagnicola sy1]|uniref:Type III restriction enzyme C-terminal endonuclease domain-containing protein n=1 Tax=Neosynechococcus sphagnicola sy1 TaxID=1497020 RepID=A0A098TH39_9CYAN|nr:hypothetical protein [Neosynechococcus sphagnicola]KGF71404.1 hypothetical protein DO97_20665 [Neosynechococcus sphagnicola sy1]